MLKEILNSGARNLGYNLEEEQLDQFLQYLDLLVEWNKKFNLTAITDPEEIIYKHFLDSMLIGKYIGPEYLLADIGTGAGFPGLPLKILFPKLKVTLIDSLTKRVNFLQEVITTLNLNEISAIHGRAEDLGRLSGLRDSFDVVVARAVSKLNVLSEYCLPFVKPGGTFIAAKGPNISEEVKSARPAVKLLSSEITEVIETSLPEREDLRTIVLITKLAPTPVEYPRKAGTPEKKPL